MKADPVPGFWSIEFHTRFFPALIWDRLRSGKRKRSGFSFFAGVYLALEICLVLIVAGTPSALSQGSVYGWIIFGIGAAGLLMLLVNSISMGLETTPSFDSFLTGIYFFFVNAGLSAGIFVMAIEHTPLYQGLQMVAAGLVAGYVLGILAGLGLQYLGWIAEWLDSLALPACVGMIVVDLVLLSGVL